MDRPALTLALVVVVTLSGCAGFGSGGDGGARTVNPALGETPTVSPTPTPEPDYPPGVAADGVDVRALTTAHDRSLQRVNSTVRFERVVVAENGTTLATRRSVTEEAGEQLGFLYTESGRLPGEEGPALDSFGFWTNGSVTATRTVNGSGGVTYQIIPGEPPSVSNTDDSGEGLAFAAFVGTDLRLMGTTVEDGEMLYVLRTDHERLNRTGRRPLQNVSGVAYVTADGVIRSYDLRYTATYGSGDDAVTATTTDRFRVSVDDTTAAPPEWVGKALANASEENEE